MKLTFLIHDRKDYRGGPVVNMRRLLPELLLRGHEIRVLGLCDADAPNLDFLESIGINVQRIPTRPIYTDYRVRWILQQLAAHPPDVFIPNSFVCGFYASRWVRESGIPTIGYFRSDDDFHNDMLEQFVYGEAQWALSGLACVAKCLRERVDSRLPKFTRTCFLPSGVPLPAKFADQRDGRDGLRVCYVGRLERKQKRIRKTCHAMLRNLAKGTCGHVGFFGAGTEKAWMEARTNEAGLATKVTFHGAVQPSQLQDALSDYQVIALLSDYEGTPGAIMDGMATGLVPITLRLPDGTSELVVDGETGLQCRDRHDDFDRCLEVLRCSKGLRAKLAANARSFIESEYSLELTTVRFEKFAAELKDSHHERRPLRTPDTITLPPVLGAMSREDYRRSLRTWVARLKGKVSKLLRSHGTSSIPT